MNIDTKILSIIFSILKFYLTLYDINIDYTKDL